MDNLPFVFVDAKSWHQEGQRSDLARNRSIDLGLQEGESGVLVERVEATVPASLALQYNGQQEQGSVPSHVCVEAINSIENSNIFGHLMDNKILSGHQTVLYRCGFCFRTFKQQFLLMRHLPTHTVEQNFACEKCGKAFIQMSSLTQHRLVHSDEITYICDLCHKKFKRASTFRMHKKTHMDIKPHICKYCNKGFTQYGNLRVHLFTHSNLRPYKCNICEKGFNQQGNLNRHYSVHYGVPEDFTCVLCPDKFLKKKVLADHMRRVHNVEMTTFRKRKPAESTCVSSKENREEGNDAVPNVTLKTPTHPWSLGGETSTIETPSVTEGSSGDNLQQVDPAHYILIDQINSEAMTQAQMVGKMQLVIFKSISGSMQLMQAIPAPIFRKQALVPVTVADLKASQIAMGDTSREFEVSTVATIQQQINDNGTLEFKEIPIATICQIKIEPVVINREVTQNTDWAGSAVTTASLNTEEAANHLEPVAGPASFEGQEQPLAVDDGNGEDVASFDEAIDPYQ